MEKWSWSLTMGELMALGWTATIQRLPRKSINQLACSTAEIERTGISKAREAVGLQNSRLIYAARLPLVNYHQLYFSRAIIVVKLALQAYNPKFSIRLRQSIKNSKKSNNCLLMSHLKRKISRYFRKGSTRQNLEAHYNWSKTWCFISLKMDLMRIR